MSNRARVVASLLALVASFAAAPVHRAAAAASSRAVVVVDFGDGVAHVNRVTFSGTSISGLDALSRAGYAPTVRSFGGNGGAVCALRDSHGAQLGCPADSTCLTCAAPAYWSYFRAPPGATSYRYSIAGAGSTAVVDGSVEAWKWGPGTPPQFVSFASVFPPAPPPTTTTRSRPTAPPATTPATVATEGTAPTTRASAPTSPSTSPITTATRTRPRASSTTPAHAPNGTRTVVATTTTQVAAPGVAAAHRAPVVHEGGGAVGPFLAFLAVVGLLVGAIVWTRRRRPHSV